LIYLTPLPWPQKQILHHNHTLSDEESGVLEAFRARMTESAAQTFGAGKGFFIRLSTRSPKDAVLSGTHPDFARVCWCTLNDLVLHIPAVH
jgi:hypothetical protein